MCKNLGNAWNQRELKWALGPLKFNPEKRLMKMVKKESNLRKVIYIYNYSKS